MYSPIVPQPNTSRRPEQNKTEQNKTKQNNETNLDDGTIPDAIVAASEHGNEIDDETIKTVSADRSSITNTL